MEYTRLTIVGSRRKADLVLPDDEPLDLLLPEVLDLLGEHAPGGTSVVLATRTGGRLDLSRSLQDQGVDHGTMLRLLPLDEAPHTPQVTEVTEAVTETGRRRADTWAPRHGWIALGALGVLLGLVTAHGVAGAGIPGLDAGAPVAWTLAAVAVVLSAGATLLARRRRRGAALAAAGAAAGTGVVLAGEVAGLAGWETAAGVVLTWALLWAVILAVAGAGLGSRGPLAGGTLALAVAAGVLGALAAGVSGLVVAGVLAVVTTAMLGLLPAIALSLAGLTAFDDRVIDGSPVATGDVESAVHRSFSVLGWTLVATTVPATVATVTLVLDGDPWALGIAAAAVAVLAARSRLFPLGPQRLVLVAAATLPPLAWLATTGMLDAAQRLTIGVVAIAALVAIGASQPREIALAKLRRAASVLEALATIALVPLLLGLLGIYRDLFEVFG